MKHENIISILSLFIVSCGAEQQFNQGNWDRPAIVRDEENSSDLRKFSAPLVALSYSFGNITGHVSISINQTDVITNTELVEVPQRVFPTQRYMTNLSCEDIASTLKPVDILDTTVEFKEFSLEDNGSRESLIYELNESDPKNGDSIHLVGKSYVIEGYIDDLNFLNPASFALIPIACGTLQNEIE